MRELVIPRYGPPEVFQVRERPDPQPGPGELRIRVRAAGVNFADILARMGLYPDAPKPPMVVGYEVAGVVDACGEGVTGPFEGDRVVALTRFGGYADVAVAPAALAFRIPETLSDAEAVTLPVNYLTAAIALYTMANVSAGETVLVHNGGGGVGLAAVQLAGLRRAEVIATASAAKHDALRAFGVAHAIDYRHLDVEAEVRRLTLGRGVDVVLDPIGGSSFASSYRLLAPLGRLVMFGISSAAPGDRRSVWHAFLAWWRLPSFAPLALINRNRGVFGLNLGHLWSERERLRGLMDLLIGEVQTRRLRPVVARTFPLERAAEAHRFIQERQNIGKVVLTT